MKLRRLIILACGGVLVVGAACGSDGGSKDSSDARGSTNEDTATTVAASASASTGDGCNTLTKADVEGVFGTGFSDVEDTTTSGTIICNLEREEPLTSAQYTIKPSSAYEYDATIDASTERGAKAQPVSGIGEKATRLVTENYGIKVVQVMAVKGDALFYVTVTQQEGDPQAKAEEFAKLLAGRL